MNVDDMTLSQRDRVRDDAVKLRALLRQVRRAQTDARDFALFELRDDLHALGVDKDDIDDFDATDDAELDHHIGRAHALATALGAEDEEDCSWLLGEFGDDNEVGAARDDQVTVTADKRQSPSLWDEQIRAGQALGVSVGGVARNVVDRVTLPFRRANDLSKQAAARANADAVNAGFVDKNGDPIAHNNQFDAERHASWNYEMAKDRNVGPGWATVFGDTVEVGGNLKYGWDTITGHRKRKSGEAPFMSLRETLMDLHNNGVGVGRARAGAKPPNVNLARTHMVQRSK